jgi:hypothetical protein
MQIFDNKKLVFFTMNERSAKISLLIIEERRSIKISACKKKKKKAVTAETNTLHDSFCNSSRSSMPPRHVLHFYELSFRFQSLQLAIEVHAGPKLRSTYK